MPTTARISRVALAKSLFAPALLLAVTESGELAAGSRYVPPGNASPVTSSQRFVLEATVGGRLDLAAGVALPLSSPRGALVVLVPVAGATAGPSGQLELTAANGRVFRPGDAFSPLAAPRTFSEPDLASFDLPAQATVLELDGTLAAGTYTLRGAGADAGEIAAVLVAEPESQLVLTARATPLAARSGEPVLVEAILRVAGEPVLGASVKARYSDAAGGHEVTLVEKRPGRYAARIVPQAGAGLLPVDLRIDAVGRLGDGTAFARTGLAGTMVTRGGADFDVAAVSIEGDSLLVPVAGAAGRYRLEATFAVARGGGGDEAESLAYSREDFTLGATMLLRLPVPAAAAGADRVAVRLLNVDSLGLEREVELDLAVGGDADLLARQAAQAAGRPGLPASKLRARQQFHEEP